MISPFKAVLGGDYKVVEKRLLVRDPHPLRPARGAEPPRSRAQIKNADRGAAYLEATMLAGFREAEAKRLFGRDPGLPASVRDDYLTPWSAAKAEKRFLAQIQLVAGLNAALRTCFHGADRRPIFGAPTRTAMIHVCSLAALPEIVRLTGASHVLTVMGNVDQVRAAGVGASPPTI